MMSNRAKITKALPALALATGAALALTACSSGPDPRDVRACQLLRATLDAADTDPLHYMMDEAIAVSPILRKGIAAIRNGMILGPSLGGYDMENKAIKATAGLCAADGVTGIGS